jgi:hypothetical protein
VIALAIAAPAAADPVPRPRAPRVIDAPTAWVLRRDRGWGVRYQALSWGSIELDVRHREADDVGGSTVMVRVNGVLDLGD